MWYCPCSRRVATFLRRAADKAGEPVGLVNVASEAGAVAAPVQACNSCGNLWANVGTYKGYEYNVFNVGGPRMWTALACRVVSRLPITHRAGVGLIPSLPFAKPKPLMKIATETGFNTLSIDRMLRLTVMLKAPLPERRPRLEEDVAYASCVVLCLTPRITKLG